MIVFFCQTAKKAELNGTCLYLSQAFLFLLSDLAFHFFIYGANNLVMFTLPSKTEKKKSEFNE